jgi:thiamine kinase-like enzyme
VKAFRLWQAVNMRDEDRISQLPCWTGAIDIAPLGGGLSNANFLVHDATGRHVVRFGKDYPFHHVSREREVMVARAAHAAGLAPAVQFAAPGVMVTEFLGAKTFSASDVKVNAARVGHLIRQFHLLLPSRVTGPGYMFWVFHVIRDYANTLQAANSPHAPLLPAMLTHHLQPPRPVARQYS